MIYLVYSYAKGATPHFKVTIRYNVTAEHSCKYSTWISKPLISTRIANYYFPYDDDLDFYIDLSEL